MLYLLIHVVNFHSCITFEKYQYVQNEYIYHEYIFIDLVFLLLTFVLLFYMCVYVCVYIYIHLSFCVSDIDSAYIQSVCSVSSVTQSCPTLCDPTD